MLEKKWEWKKVHIIALLALLYAGCLLVLSFIGYSDGDDAFFLEYCGSMGFFEYLQWRYKVWTGRMISEGFMHIFFNMDLWVWRVVNAGMLVALPVVLVALKNKVAPAQDIRTKSDKNAAYLAGLVMAVLTYALLDIKAFGYSAVWITGSMNYLWPMVCGIVALGVVADVTYGKDATLSMWKYAAASVCAVIAAMSSEQMGAVLLAFEGICIAEKVWKKKHVQVGLLVQSVVTLGAFLVSSLAPGNELRIVAAIEHNMPQFEQLGFGERFFVLAQWLVSSFANESAVFLIAIWLLGVLLLGVNLKSGKLAGKHAVCAKAYSVLAVVFAVVALAGKCGVTALNDIGINLAELAGLVERVPQAADMSTMQWMVLVWWLLAMLFTLFFLWEVSDGKWVILLTYMGAVACEVILIFSPTIYSSGERVFFLAGLMLMFIIMVLYEKLPKGKMRVAYVGILLFLGISNLLLQAVELLAMIAG